MIEYTLRNHPRARRISITVQRDGSVRVTKPRRVSTRDVESFLQKCADWIQRARARSKALPKTSKIELPKRQYGRFKKSTADFAHTRLQHFSKQYGFSYHKLSIRNQKSRWGSCSRKGDISLNYRIIFLPERLADYIIVHELCHTREMNHSKRFWALVAMAIPDHRERRKEIRRYERGLLFES